jgi:NADH-quinone oxidoreductase subunit M
MVMLAHGISTGGLFLCIGVIYERRHTRRIDEFGGIAAVMPRFTAVFMIMTFASIGLPALCGFVGEFLVLSGTFGAYQTWGKEMVLFAHPKVLAGVATSGVILAAMYMLYLFQKVMFGPLTNSRNKELPDLDAREMAVFAPMVLMAFWMGIYPNTFLSTIDPAMKRTMSQVQAKLMIPLEEGMRPTAVPEKAAPANPGAVEAPPNPDEADRAAREAAKPAEQPLQPQRRPGMAE